MTDVYVANGSEPSVKVPALWEKHNWERAYKFLREVDEEHGEKQYQPNTYSYLSDKIASGFDLKRALDRRSLTAVDDKAIEVEAFSALVRCAYQASAASPSIFFGVVTTNVVGWPDGYWLIDHTPRSLMRSAVPHDSSDLADLIQGQFWANGTGVCFLLGADLEQSPQAERESFYAKTLIDCGRIGHSLLLEGQHHGLVARMTPAVKESTATRILQLDESRDVLYFLRIAYPKKEPR